MSTTDTEAWCEHYMPGTECTYCSRTSSTERDERLREALEEARQVADLYGNPTAVGLDDEVVVHPLVVLTLAAEVARLDAVVTAVREAHQPVNLANGWVACSGCTFPSSDGIGRTTLYPCPTVRALEGGAR